MKSISFEKLMEKVVECGKVFGNKSSHSTSESKCLKHKEKSKPHDSSRGERKKRGNGINTLRGRGVDTTKVIYPISIVHAEKIMGQMK